MVQIYFICILLNLLAGLVLMYGKSKISAEEDEVDDKKSKKISSFNETFSFINSKSFRLVLGIMLVFVGFMKILSVYKSDIPIIGDLFPVLSSFMAGTSILLEFYIETADTATNIPENVKKFFIGGKKYIGITCIAVAVLHFIFPGVVLL